MRKIVEPKWEEELSRRIHDWYLQGTIALHPESYNQNAQKSYEELTEEQREIDRFMAGKIIELLTTDREETLRVLEGMKQKHWVFECSGPRPNKTTKFEDWCDDPECRSDDNKRVKAHNTALDDAIIELKKIWNTN